MHVHGYCLYDYLVSCYETSIPADNIQTAKRWMHTYLTYVGVSSYNVPLLQDHLTSGRVSSIMKWHVHQNQIFYWIHINGYWLELLVIVPFLIFNALFSPVFINRWHLSGLVFKKLCENQLESFIIIFYK